MTIQRSRTVTCNDNGMLGSPSSLPQKERAGA